jgi:hypothetical protein
MKMIYRKNKGSAVAAIIKQDFKKSRKIQTVS